MIRVDEPLNAVIGTGLTMETRYCGDQVMVMFNGSQTLTTPTPPVGIYLVSLLRYLVVALMII